MEAGIVPLEMGVAVARVSFLPEGAAMIWNESEPEVPPPGGGVSTVTGAVPSVATSEAGIWASSRELLAKAVVRGLPFQSTTEVLINPEPFTVSVKLGVPTRAADGDSEVRMGTPPAMSKVTAPDVPPPGVGLNTVTEALPAFCTSEAWMEAVNWVALTKLVARFAPFHRTTELEMKEEPVTVSVKAASPTLALDGETDATLGAGFGGVGVPPPPPPPPQAVKNRRSPTAAEAARRSKRNRRVVRCIFTSALL